MGKQDLYIDQVARELTLEALKEMMSAQGATELYIKFLSPNDNSKNQPYLGGDLSALSHIPTGDVSAEKTTSRKSGAAGGWRLKAPLHFYWLTPQGGVFPAPDAQIIFYPQYPEARLSGFIRGAKAAPRSLMDPSQRGREPGRILLMGTTEDGRVLAWVAAHDSAIAHQLEADRPTKEAGVFYRLNLEAAAVDERQQLLSELCRIYGKEWIIGCKLAFEGDHWVVKPHKAQQAGGYTLEAELGVTPNGFAEPDYLGWEVKQFSVTSFDPLRGLGAMTLMTPQPDAGFYATNGVEEFVRRYGYPDKLGRPDRLNFGGTHYFSKRHATTKLELTLPGYDYNTGKITDLAGGGLALSASNGDIAALWSFPKLIDHWKRKHGQAVFVPSQKDTSVSPPAYRFGREVFLAEGTEFLKLLRAVEGGLVYYDPGIKLENASSSHASSKARSQFRIKVKNLPTLYDRVMRVNSCDCSVLDGIVDTIK